MSYKGKVPDHVPTVEPRPKTKFDNGHWSFPEQLGEGVGFIYIIRDKYMRKLYLGKKHFRAMRGRNKGVESNWRKYMSSSKYVKLMVANRPLSEFEFICIESYTTKGTLSYSETWSLCQVEAPTSDEWMNTLIEKVSWNVKEPISDRHKERMKLAIEWGEFND
ncbi:hypothetical protein N9112_00250 [bacterium]|nr:hypothetical protein [bacterium]